jgi:plastocyanin
MRSGRPINVGLNPDDRNPLTDPAPANRFNGENRLESVSFPEPGVYLVICNVTPHLRDGMYAYVKVSH